MARWFVLLLMGAAFNSFALPQSSTKETPTQPRQELLALIPDPAPSRAKPQDKAAFYGPDNLYQYMDGGAEVFLAYDLQTLMHQEFRAGETELTVDVFDMGAPENAFGIYAAERSPSYRFIPIGSEAYKNDGILNFLQGRYYVKLAAFGDAANPVLEGFAKALSARIGKETSLPLLLQQLPQENRKPHSEQYLLKDPLGHSFLGPAYVASYGLDKQESVLLISVAANEADAQRRLELLAQHFRTTGQCESAPELGPGAIRASNSFEGKLLARTKGRYVIVVMNAASGAPELLNDTANRLK